MSVKQTYMYGLRHSVNILVVYIMYLLVALFGMISQYFILGGIAIIGCSAVCALYKIDRKYTYNYIGLLFVAKGENNPKAMLRKFKGSLIFISTDQSLRITITDIEADNHKDCISDLFDFRLYARAKCRYTAFYNLSTVYLLCMCFIMFSNIYMSSLACFSFVLPIVAIIIDNLLTTYSLTEIVLVEGEEVNE